MTEPLKSWVIGTEISGRHREIEILLHGDLRGMRTAATYHDREIGKGKVNGAYKNALGLTSGWWSDEGPSAGHIRFTRGHTTPEIVAHEVAHMAMWLYRLDCLEGSYTGDFSVAWPIDSKEVEDHFQPDNERFAYIMGALFATVWELVGSE